MNNTNTEWKCPICGYKAKNDDERNSHIKNSLDKPHQELIKEKAKERINATKKEAGEALEDVKGRMKKIF